jgi:hypothetical protein
MWDLWKTCDKRASDGDFAFSASENIVLRGILDSEKRQ